MMIHWILFLIWIFQLFLIQMMIPQTALNSFKVYKIGIYSETLLVPRRFLALTRDLPVVCSVGTLSRFLALTRDLPVVCPVGTLSRFLALTRDLPVVCPVAGSTEETITESMERTTIDPNSFIIYKKVV